MLWQGISMCSKAYFIWIFEPTLHSRLIICIVYNLEFVMERNEFRIAWNLSVNWTAEAKIWKQCIEWWWESGREGKKLGQELKGIPPWLPCLLRGEQHPHSQSAQRKGWCKLKSGSSSCWHMDQRKDGASLQMHCQIFLPMCPCSDPAAHVGRNMFPVLLW